MKDFSFITNSHPNYIEQLYNDYLKSPESIDPELKKFFEGLDFAFNTFGINKKENDYYQHDRRETPNAHLADQVCFDAGKAHTEIVAIAF